MPIDPLRQEYIERLADRLAIDGPEGNLWDSASSEAQKEARKLLKRANILVPGEAESRSRRAAA